MLLDASLPQRQKARNNIKRYIRIKNFLGEIMVIP
jgi:hypothetical protein